MKKQITMNELKSLIKEEAQKLNRKALLENEKKRLQEELGSLGEIQMPTHYGDPYYDDPGDWQDYIDKDGVFIDYDEADFDEYHGAEFEELEEYLDMPVYKYELGGYGTGKVFAGDIVDFGESKGFEILDLLSYKIKSGNIQNLLTHQNFIKFIEKAFNEPMEKIVYDLLDSGVIGPDANNDDYWKENEIDMSP